MLLFRSDVFVTSLPFFLRSFFGRLCGPFPGFLFVLLFFAAAKSETGIVGRRCRVSVLLFKSDVYVMSLPFFHCSFFRTFFGSLSWFLSSVMID